MAHGAHTDFTAGKEAHRSSVTEGLFFLPLIYPTSLSGMYPCSSLSPSFDHIFLADTAPGSTMWTCALRTHTWTLSRPNNWRLPLGTLHAILPSHQRRAHQHALKQSTTAPLLHQFILTFVTSLAHAACWYCSSKIPNRTALSEVVKIGGYPIP